MASTPGHDIVVKTSLELIGVALLAILADTGKAVGKVIVVFMVSIALIWFMTNGAKFLGPIVSRLQSKPSKRIA